MIARAQFLALSKQVHDLELFARTIRDDIRQSRNNSAERLGFMGRVINGTNPRAWLKEVGQRISERTDFPDANAE